MRGKLYISSILWFFFSIIQFSNILNAQNTSSIFQIGTKNSESVDLLATTSKDKLLVSGRYDHSFEWNSVELTSQGANDCYIAQLDGDIMEWIFAAGSTGEDEILAMTTDNNNHIIACLSYLNSIQIGDSLLVPSSGSRGLVLFKLDTAGKLLWLQDINSTGEQSITALLTDQQNQIYATGSFAGTFTLDGQSMLAQANQDLFVLKFDPFGKTQWMQQAGLTGTVRPQALSLTTSQDALYISGIFDGTVAFADEILQANTNDFDVFLVQMDSMGNTNWSKKAGGVFEDNNTAVLVDSMDRVFVIGDFQGILQLNDSLHITSNGIMDNNLYVLAYHETGIPLWARSLGGTNFDFVEDAIWLTAEQIAISGYFQDTFVVDQFSAIATNNFDTYVLGLSSTTGQAQWLEHFQSEDLVIGNALSYLNGQVILGGAFTANLAYEDIDLASIGFFDAFLCYFDNILTPTEAVFSTPNNINIFPNPTADFLKINTTVAYDYLKVFDTQGQVLLQHPYSDKIAVKQFKNGIYYLYLWNSKGERASIPFVVQR